MRVTPPAVALLLVAALLCLSQPAPVAAQDVNLFMVLKLKGITTELSEGQQKDVVRAINQATTIPWVYQWQQPSYPYVLPQQLRRRALLQAAAATDATAAPAAAADATATAADASATAGAAAANPCRSPKVHFPVADFPECDTKCNEKKDRFIKIGFNQSNVSPSIYNTNGVLCCICKLLKGPGPPPEPPAAASPAAEGPSPAAPDASSVPVAAAPAAEPTGPAAAPAEAVASDPPAPPAVDLTPVPGPSPAVSATPDGLYFAARSFGVAEGVAGDVIRNLEQGLENGKFLQMLSSNSFKIESVTKMYMGEGDPFTDGFINFPPAAPGFMPYTYPPAPPVDENGTPVEGSSGGMSGGTIGAIVGGVVGGVVLLVAIIALAMSRKRSRTGDADAELMAHKWKQERTTAAQYQAAERYHSSRSTTVSRDELEAARSARRSESISAAGSMGSGPALPPAGSFRTHRGSTTDSQRSSLGLSTSSRYSGYPPPPDAAGSGDLEAAAQAPAKGSGFKGWFSRGG